MKNKNKLTRFFATLRMTRGVGWAFSPTNLSCWGRNPNLQTKELPEAGQYGSKQELSVMAKELPEAGQYGSKQELSVMAKELPEAGQYMCHPEFYKTNRRACESCEPVCVAVQHDNRRVAFTLAEVLITLGVIGVVAAMTIPTLVKNYQKQVVSKQLKKFYSGFLNVLKMSEVDNGDFETWNLTAPGAYDTYISPYIRKIKSCKDCQVDYNIHKKFDGTPCAYDLMLCNYNSSSWYLTPNIIYTSDGVTVGISDHAGHENQNQFTLDTMTIVVDVNGKAGPNICSKDIFYFELTKKYGFKPYGYGNGNETWNRVGISCKNKDGINNSTVHGCNKGSSYALFCTYKLYCDNWEIKDDYPW